MQILWLSFVAILNLASSNIDDLAVKYIVDVITQEQARAAEYKLPNNAEQYKATNQTLTEYGTFDYIIVGAGSAGAVLATRLSEINDLKILLIEAGGPPTTFVDIPGMANYLYSLEFNWNFKSVPQTTCCLGMVERRCYEARGKGLGGSTLINALMYVRGNKNDFDSWASGGNAGWSYKEVLPYFIKSENSQVNGDAGYHGKGGLLNVEYHKPDSPLLEAFFKANQQLGREVVDYNGKTQLGVARTQINTIRGRREHTARAFLAKAASRNNLKILSHAYAKKIFINNVNKQATGVAFDYEGQSYYAKSGKEVILSAGSIGSPQLLMLSGIGPSEVLEPLSIPVISDLPVGKNYQNHATFIGLYFTTNYSEPVTSLYENSWNYLNDLGPFTIAENAQAIGFFRTKSAKTPKSVPNIEVIFIPQNATSRILQLAFNINNETFETYSKKINVNSTFAVYIMLLHPKSRGNVRLQSSDPYEYPNIDPNFLSDENNEDIETMYEAVNLVREFADTSSFRKWNTTLLYEVLPACRNYTYLSKEQWFCQIRHLTAHLYHPVGTCKMSPNRSGVVNNNLQVHGVKHLRVIDASIIPDVTSGHINAPTIMLAEKMADVLKNSYL